MSIRNGLSYEGYINSSSWERRRVAYFAKHPKVCVACGSNKKIQLHHKTYDRMGAELDGDLAPLCEFCHSTLHQWHRSVGGSLWEMSEKFIDHFNKQRLPKKKERDQVQSTRFVPKHLRGAKRDEQGRLISTSDWWTEVRVIRTDLS